VQVFFPSIPSPYTDTLGILSYPMAVDDFIMTIDSDVDDQHPLRANKSARNSNSQAVDDAHLNPEFSFDPSGDAYTDLLNHRNDLRDLVKTGSKPVSSFHPFWPSKLMSSVSEGTDICRRYNCKAKIDRSCSEKEA
jgi:hypothetical protein